MAIVRIAVVAALAGWLWLGFSREDAVALAAIVRGFSLPVWALGRLLFLAAKLAAFSVGAWAAGALLSPWIYPREDAVPATGRMALGVAAFAGTLRATALLGLAGRPAGVALFFLLAIPALLEAVRRGPRGGGELGGGLGSLWSLVRANAAAATLIVVPCGFLAAYAGASLMVPDNFWDALSHHLPLVRRTLAEGVAPGPPPFFFGFPSLFHSVALSLISVGGEFLVRAVNTAFLIACALVIRDMGKHLGVPPGAGAAAGLAFATTPIALLLGVHAGTDMAVAWLSLLAVATFATACPRWPLAGKGPPAGRLFLAAGLFCGLATAVKYQGSAGLFLLLAFVVPRGAGKGARRKVRLAVLLVTGWLSAYAPWGAGNWLASGNPVFPFARGVFGGTGYSVETAESYSEELSSVARGEIGNEGSPSGLRSFFARYKFGLFGPALLGAVFLAWRSATGVLPLAWAAGFLSLWALSVPALRYALPGWGLLLLAAFAGASSSRSPVPGRLLLGLHIASACVWFPMAVHLVDGPVPFLRGGETVVGYYARMQGNSPGHARAWFETTGGAGPRRRLLCVGEPRGYLCGDWAVAPSRFEPSPLALVERESRTPGEMAKKLRQMGVGWVLVNEAELMKAMVLEGTQESPTPGPVMKAFFATRLRLAYARNWLRIYEVGRPGSRMPEAMAMRPSSESVLLLVLHDRIRSALASGDVPRAVRLGYAAVMGGPQSGLAWAALGDALLSAERASEAVGAYENAVRAGARNAGLYLNMARAYSREGSNGRAQRAYALAAELDPVTRDTRDGIEELKSKVTREFLRGGK